MRVFQNSILRRVGLIPIWLLTLAMLPVLPRNHPWHDRNMTLAGWCAHGTDNAVMIGWNLIAGVLCIAAVKLKLLLGT